jgi:hypothetical protein
MPWMRRELRAEAVRPTCERQVLRESRVLRKEIRMDHSRVVRDGLDIPQTKIVGSSERSERDLAVKRSESQV